jgi:competence protein ComEC
MRLLSKTQLFFYEAPLIRILIPFIAGIFFQLHFDFNNRLICATSIGALIVLHFLFQQFSLKNLFKFHWLNSALIQVVIFFIGIFITQLNDETQHKNYYKKFISSSKNASIRLLENPVEKTGSYKALAEVETIGKQKTTGQTILYFDKKSYNNNFIYGDILLIPNHFTEIRNAGNPGCFNYKFACFTQGITHQIFLHESDCKKVENQSNIFWKKLWQIRDTTLSVLEKNIVEEREVGVAQALLIGFRDNLDKDLQQVYADTGIVHILAISGMHLALIFGLLNFCLSFLYKKRN